MHLAEESGTITLDEFVSGKARNLAKLTVTNSQVACLMPRNDLLILVAQVVFLVLIFD